MFQFLWNLNYSTDNYITVFNEYEAYFLNTRPKLNLDGIKRLLLGDKSLRGLIEICGNISNPTQSSTLHHICSKAFKFLAMLLDHEYNKEAEIYIKIYKSAGIPLVASLKLGKKNIFNIIAQEFFIKGFHIKPNSQKQCKSYALKLLDLYLSHNLEKAQENLTKILEGNEEALKEYEKWKISKRFSSHSTEQFEFSRAPSESSSINPFLYLSFDNNNIKRKNIPLTKWLPIVLKDAKYAQFQMKHLNEENLKISTCSKGKFEDCFEKLTKGQKYWDKLLVEESKSINNEGLEIFIEKFMWWKDNPEAKTFVFVHKRVYEKKNTENKLCKISMPCNFQLKSNEVLLTMNITFITKRPGTRKKQLRSIGNEGDLTKIKMIIKELDNETKEELKLEMKGLQHRFIDNLMSFKNFLEGSGINL